MEQLNACAECGFTTANLREFERHVERHEGGECNSRKSSRAMSAVAADNADFQRLLDLALASSCSPPPSSAEQPHQQANRCPSSQRHSLSSRSAQEEGDDEKGSADAAMFGHLADLSRFLSAASSGANPPPNGGSRSPSSAVSPMDLSLAGDESASKRPRLEPKDGEEGGQKTTPTKSRQKGSGGGKTTHKCPHCTFTTYMSQHMKSHLRAHENFVGQMYVCDVCGMAFSQKANMHRHRGTHSGVKPYECRFCGKRFFRKDQMQEHSMTHIKTGDDFDCPVSGCECKFSQHSMLRQHLDDKHSISTGQLAHCKRCALQFANSRRLLLHYQTKHDEYYSASSPLPDGQSPVKRVLPEGSGEWSPSSSTVGPDKKPEGAKRRRKAKKTPKSEGSEKGGATENKRAGGLSGRRTNGGREQQPHPNGGYNVAELLRLDCGGAVSANGCSGTALLAEQDSATAASSLLTMPSPASSTASASGMELFRDQLLRNCSASAAAMFAPVAHQQAAATAAVAQLFMQSLFMSPAHPGHLAQMNGNDMRPYSEQNGAAAQKHLPLAKSPDCRELMLNGLMRAKGAPSPLPRAAMSSLRAEEEGGGDEELSESEGRTEVATEAPVESLMESDNDNCVKEAESKSANNIGALPRNDVPQMRPPDSSAHSSITHSPSSSSGSSSNGAACCSSSSAKSASGTLLLDTSTASNPATVESSPQKALNSKLFSSALLSRALIASKESALDAGEMDCAHCGLVFSDQTLYLLHKGLHSEADPWRCNLCGQSCCDRYTFTTHMISSDHS